MIESKERENAARVIQKGFRAMKSRKDLFEMQGARPFWGRVRGIKGLLAP